MEPRAAATVTTITSPKRKDYYESRNWGFDWRTTNIVVETSPNSLIR